MRWLLGEFQGTGGFKEQHFQEEILYIQGSVRSEKLIRAAGSKGHPLAVAGSWCGRVVSL